MMWSPRTGLQTAQRILFAVGEGDNRFLYTMASDGQDVNIVNNSFTTGGRSDWAPFGNILVSYSGEPWARNLFTMNIDGSGLSEIYSGGNVQGPTFSPDGNWVAFTGYIDEMGNNDGCEIYAMRLADKLLRRLTNNNYCDWQPRWGP